MYKEKNEVKRSATKRKLIIETIIYFALFIPFAYFQTQFVISSTLHIRSSYVEYIQTATPPSPGISPNIPRKAWTYVGEKLGIAIVNLVYAFDPELVVIGGGMTHQFNLFKKSMMKEISKRNVKIKVVKGSLDSGIIGAGALVQYN